MAGYIGPIPVPQATQSRETFTATASQTSFGTAGYQVGYLDVFMNGVKLAPADFTATNGSDVVLASGAAVNDIIEVVSYSAFEVLNQNFTGTTVVDNLTVGGNLTVDGTTTTINSTTLNVDDINITVASGAADSAAANGAGLTVDGAGATFNYSHSGTKWTMNKPLDVGGALGVAGTVTANNVGIGTSSPSRPLHVNNNGESFIRITSSDTGNSGIEFGDQSDSVQGAIFQNSTDNSLRFNGYNNSERMRISAAGNVGIGTTSPSDKLHIDGASAFIRVNRTDGEAGITLMYNGSNSTRSNIATATNGDLIIDTANTERMRIDASGNVGIGTTSPDATLELSNSSSVPSISFGRTPYSSHGSLTIGGSLVGALTSNTDKDDNSTVNVGASKFLLGNGDTRFYQAGSAAAGSARTFNESMRIDSSGNLILKATSDTGNRIQINGADETSELLEVGVTSGGAQLTATHASGGSNVSDLIIRTRGGGSTAERVRVTHNGLTFNGDTAAANALNDYEEGTWSPSIRATTTDPTVTYATRLGAYVIIGNTVYISFYIYCHAGNVTGGVGGVQIGNLPVAIQPSGGYSSFGLPFIPAGYVFTGGASQAAAGNNTMRWQANANPSTKINLYASNTSSHGSGAWELSGAGTFPIA